MPAVHQPRRGVLENCAGLVTPDHVFGAMLCLKVTQLAEYKLQMDYTVDEHVPKRGWFSV